MRSSCAESSREIADEGLNVTNRRAHERFPIEIEVSFESEHNFYTGFTENISEGGLFVATHCIRPTGSRFELTMRLAQHDGPIEATVEVRWIRPYHERLDVPPGMGVCFVDLPPAALEAIRAFLKRREPIFFEA